MWTSIKGVWPEPAPGHLHQGGIWISRGGTNHVARTRRGGGGIRVGSVQSMIACSCWRSLKHAIAFLCALFYRFHFRFRNRSRSARRGEDEKWGGTVIRLGGHSPRMPPLGAGPGVYMFAAWQNKLWNFPNEILLFLSKFKSQWSAAKAMQKARSPEKGLCPAKV